jgi:hypothetical protein
LISARTGQHLKKNAVHQLWLSKLTVFFGSLSSASILRFEELTHLLYILMLPYVDVGNGSAIIAGTA